METVVPRARTWRVEDYIPRSFLDKITFGYYAFQFVTTIVLDMQATLPAFLYPSWIRYFYTHHLETWRDPFMANSWDHPWYFCIAMWEYWVQVPFFFIGAKAYWQRVKGQSRNSWIRIPVIMYCSQSITAVSGVVVMALMEDFTHYTTPHVPSGIFQRLKLASLYGFFVLFCVLHLLDALTGRDYVEGGEEGERGGGRGGDNKKKDK